MRESSKTLIVNSYVDKKKKEWLRANTESEETELPKTDITKWRNERKNELEKHQKIVKRLSKGVSRLTVAELKKLCDCNDWDRAGLNKKADLLKLVEEKMDPVE